MRLGHRILQALFVSVIAAKLVSIVSERFVPLVGLLRLSLVFPDVAPSRFGVALKAGSTKKLSDQIPTLSGDAGEAARQAIEFVTRSQKHDRLTRGHMERVRAYAEMIGVEMGLNETELNQLRWGTLLHDIGKLRVPTRILQKPRAISVWLEEFVRSRTHMT